MSLVKIKKGLNINLKELPIENGALYITEDKHEFFYDDIARHKIVDTDAMIYDTEESIQLETTLLILGSGLINYSNLK